MPIVKEQSIPIVVDLDGSYIATDTLYESLVLLFFRRLLYLFLLPYWLSLGKAGLKASIANLVQLNWECLPRNDSLCKWLTLQKSEGREIILATAANEKVARSLASQSDLFSAVISSDSKTNIKGKQKALAINAHFGGEPWCYVGDSRADIDVWSSASSAVLAGRYSDNLKQRVQAILPIEQEFPLPSMSIRGLLKQIRIHQWAKNLLVFAPAIAAHLTPTSTVIQSLLVAFLAFSCVASSVYLINDLVDLNADRQHPVKRFRPLASGQMPIPLAFMLAPTLLFLAVWIGASLPSLFLTILCIYFFTTCSYSFSLKRKPVLDCVMLAVLFTMRIIAGAYAIGLELSIWMLMFSIFLFLSLAFAKRFVELQQVSEGKESLPGRGYIASDIGFVSAIGTASAVVSVLVLGLYLNTPQSQLLYSSPIFLWALALIYLFWISWVWFKANRREMDDDPVIFAMKDRTSLACGFLFITSFLLASQAST